jgi:hypothetical protein
MAAPVAGSAQQSPAKRFAGHRSAGAARCAAAGAGSSYRARARGDASGPGPAIVRRAMVNLAQDVPPGTDLVRVFGRTGEVLDVVPVATDEPMGRQTS